MGAVATGSVLLTPKFDNLEASLTKQLNGAWAGVNASASKAGSGASKAFGGSMVAQGGIIGAASAITSRAFDAIADSMGAAISRVDTMANFPKVMVNLGYSSEDAKKSIERMSAAIDGMPTTLSGITGMTQQLAPLCGGLDEATSISIAMNNALLAGGAGAADVSRAMQQYSQILSKGKPELQDWKTLQEVMPGQLNQIAQALLGPTANSRDLYGALKDGTLSMDDFNGAMVALNEEGVNGFASFAQQARDATQGIGTAIENARNRVAKALQKIIEAIGQTDISGAINSITSQFDKIADAAVAAVNFVKEHFGEMAPIVAGAAAAFAGFSVLQRITGLFAALTGPLMAARKGLVVFRLACAIDGPLSALKNGIALLGGTLSTALGGPVGIAVTAIAGLAAAFAVAYNTNEGFRNAVQQAWSQIQALAAQVWPYIQQAISTACAVIQGIVQTVWPVIQGIITNVMTNVQLLVQTVWPLVQQAFMGACTVIGGIVQAVWPVIQQVVTAVMQAIQFIVETVWPIVQQAFTVAGQAIEGVINAVFPFIQTVIETVMNVINGIISTVLAVINGDWGAAWNGIKGVAQSIWDGIGNIINAGINMAKGVIESVLGAIKGIWDGAWNGLKGFCADIWEGIKSGVSNGIQGVMNFIGELPGKITGFFSNAGSWLVGAGKSILNGLKNGLMSAFEGVKDFVGGIGDWIVSHKGPPSYDKVMLVRNGELIMGGLLKGVTAGFKPVQSFIGDATDEVAGAFGKYGTLSANSTVRATYGAGAGAPTADDIASAIVRGLSRTGFRLDMDADGMALRLAPAIDRQLGYRTEMGYA